MARQLIEDIRMRFATLPLTLLLIAGALHAADDTATVPTLEERQKAVQEQIKATQEMQGKSIEDQLKIAQEWAKKHRTAMAPAQQDQEVVQAYAFRTTLTSDPQCQSFAQQADSIVQNPQLDSAEKAEALRQIGGQASKAGCISAQ